MTMIVNWQNATRPPAERVRIELNYRNRLLELCSSEQHAKKLSEERQDPCSAWQRFNMVAHIEATAGLPPSERKQARFTVRFEKG